MQPNLEIAYRVTEPSAAFESKVHEHLNLLQSIFKPIHSVRVVLDASRRRGLSHMLYEVRLEVGVPGKKLTVNIDSNTFRRESYDPYLALSRSFNAMEKRLRRYRGRIRRAEGRRRHLSPPRAYVERIFPQDGYGFLISETGEEVYFHENSVLRNEFMNLRVNDKVRFASEQGDKGPQASTVELLRHEAA